MRPIQFILLAFVLLALGKVIHKYKQQGVKRLEFFFWVAVWVCAALIITFPNDTHLLAHLLGIGRGADLIMYTSLLIAFYLIFRIHLTLERVEQEITEIVRAMALERLKEVSDPGSGEGRKAP